MKQNFYGARKLGAELSIGLKMIESYVESPVAKHTCPENATSEWITILPFYDVMERAEHGVGGKFTVMYNEIFILAGTLLHRHTNY